MDLLQRFQKNWLQKKFADSEQQVLLAVSGGIDSMVMAELSLKSNIRFAIAHCNFQLRGTASDMDEQLVRNWADKNSVVFHTAKFDTKQKCEEWKKGVQETARILRYEWLDTVCKENKYSKVVTAHHANDNVETLVMNLFKGTGIAGMHGIPEVSDSAIRPLLFATRDDIVIYAKENGVPYRDDASNATDDYLRNSVRHNIIPALQQIFPNAVVHANESIRRFADAEVLYRRTIEAEKKKLIEKRGKDLYLPVLKLQKREALEAIVYEVFKEYGFSSAQMPFIIQLIAADSGKYVESESHRVIKNRQFLIITAKSTSETDHITIEGVPCIISVNGYKLKFNIENKPTVISSEPNVAFIDTRNISFPIVLRKWHTGDYFYPLGMGMKKKKLSKLFIDLKIPVHQKEHTWLVECQKRIAWVTGLRLDERFKVKESTEQVLRIEMIQDQK